LLAAAGTRGRARAAASRAGGAGRGAAGVASGGATCAVCGARVWSEIGSGVLGHQLVVFEGAGGVGGGAGKGEMLANVPWGGNGRAYFWLMTMDMPDWQ